MDFREQTKLKIAISQMKDEGKAMNKGNKLKKGIGLVACFAIMFSGIVYAKDIEKFMKNIFANSTDAIDVATEKGYVQNLDNNFVYDKEIGIKVDKLVLDDINLNISFNYEIKKENVKSIRIKDIDIKTEKDKVVFSSELQYAETKEDLPLYNSLNWMNESIKISDTIFMDSILLGLRPEREDFSKLNFNIKSFQITYIDESFENVEGNWNFDITISEEMRKSINKEYTLSENNEYVKNCTGTISPTGMIVEMNLYEEFDAGKYVEDNMDNLNDTGLFYIKYNNELLLPSYLEAGDSSGYYKFVIHYENIGLFFDNIDDIELYLMPFDTTIKLIEK